MPETVPVVQVAPRLLSLEDAGRYLGVSVWTLRDLIQAGRVSPVRLPGPQGSDLRRILLDRLDLDALIERRKA